MTRAKKHVQAMRAKSRYAEAPRRPIPVPQPKKLPPYSKPGGGTEDSSISTRSANINAVPAELSTDAYSDPFSAPIAGRVGTGGKAN